MSTEPDIIELLKATIPLLPWTARPAGIAHAIYDKEGNCIASGMWKSDAENIVAFIPALLAAIEQAEERGRVKGIREAWKVAQEHEADCHKALEYFEANVALEISDRIDSLITHKEQGNANP